LFFSHGTITLLTVIFIAVYIKETEGLSDREKKVMYAPKEYRDIVRQKVLSGFCTTDFEN
jgi:hypothetical protein